MPRWNGLLPAPPPRERARLELMDEPARFPEEEIRRALRDLARVNRVFGNRSLLLRHLRALTRGVSRDGELLLLDIGTGGGDLPAAVAAWAKREGRRVYQIAMDRSPEILRHAADRLRGSARVGILRADALRLPLADGSVDIAFCSQVLHHLPDAAAAAVLGEMGRVSRLGWIVSDLRRGRLACFLTRLAMRLVSRSPMIRFDGPLSIRRAFTLDEYRRLAREAGADGAAVRKHRFFRAAIVWRRGARAMMPIPAAIGT
ncbi:MAG: methyltransferase domain-containing protein [Acidobacteria bacterium]|nr:methyltransferase domain-containing protein [Acidobacteriota bacterium]